MLLDGLDIEPVRPVDRPIPLRNRHDHGAALPAELGAVVADVAEPLDDDALALDTRRKPPRLHVVRVGARLAEPDVDPAARRFHSAADTSLADGLPSDARQGVNMTGVEGGVGVGDPGHLSRASPVV